MTFLNHGSFGACPQPVFERYQHWQRELERNPVAFIGRQLPDLLRAAREQLARYLGATADELTFVPNATHGVNIVARSLKLKPGDEVLTTDHEYGAVNNTWRFNCEKQGARYINQPIPTPIQDPQAVVDQLWAGVTERTRVISLSHITSPTALIFPVAEVCRRAREAGIITVIDGAHAPGQIDLDMGAIGADFYTGNAHKWLSSAKGAAFLYARADRQALLEPLVVSHGWNRQNSTQSQFFDYFNWTGTDDPSAYLSVAAAIDFQAEHNWPAVRAACHQLALVAHHRLLELSDRPPLSPESMWAQLVATPLPGRAADYQALWDRYRIIAPIFEWNGIPLVRVSIQAYNTPRDVDRLVDALTEMGTERKA
ncbi:MAG: aminotransferase class V-fold PLP-dependent enzyme [Caldilineaceae bacterium]|nr:aminotransferase class V-fold PLP-dependent enzyme [Caldilineaceae bacterium]